jgi:type IV fimbrial biogenesis protein FimT
MVLAVQAGHMTIKTKMVAKGFTLVELMVTLAIVAILASVAVPSFQDMVNNNRLTSQANEFITALNYSRSEAVKRGTSITLTANTSGNWDDGWTIKDGTDTIRNYAAFKGSSALTSTTAPASVTYKGTGFVSGTADLSFDLCDNRSGETGRTIEISVTGRVSVSNKTCS